MTSMTDRRSGWTGRALARSRVLLGMAGLTLALSGCGTGNYPLDVFPEMHYQQSFRSQEGPRMEAPIDSVPQRSTSGTQQGKPEPVDLGRAPTLKSTVASNPQNVQAGMTLYNRNCSVCHGPAGKGDGALVQYFQQGKDNKTPEGAMLVPIDLTSPRGRIWTSGEGGGLYSIISNGQGQFMPPFRALLTQDERWLIVQAVKDLQAKAAPTQ